MEQNPLIERFRIAKPGRVKALGGVYLDITAEHLAGAVACFEHIVASAQAAGGTPSYPVGKVGHINTPNTPILGEFRVLAIEPDGWLCGDFAWNDAETMEAGHTHLSRAVSMEMDFDVEVYGKPFAARLVDVALLPAEALPATPGAGSMRAVASAAEAGLRVRFACGEPEPDEESDAQAAASTTDEESTMDEATKAAFAQMSEALAGIASAVTALTAKVDALGAKDEAAAQAAEAAKTEAAAAADTASITAFTAALSAATAAGKVTQGEAEELTAVAQTMPIEGRAKLAASFDKRPIPGTVEKLPNGKEPVKLSAEEKGTATRELIRAKLALDPTDYSKAVRTAMKERPELFQDDEVK